jgi:hypothetical protein
VKNVMCKIGDIILIERYKDREKTLGRHSFVVIDDQNGEIQGLPYDMICNVFSSFKSEEQKKRKLGYPSNFPIAHEDTNTKPDNGKSGYIKTDQLYFFNKSKIEYTVIGNIQPDILELVLEFIDTSDFEAEAIIDNL